MTYMYSPRHHTYRKADPGHILRNTLVCDDRVRICAGQVIHADVLVAAGCNHLPIWTYL